MFYLLSPKFYCLKAHGIIAFFTLGVYESLVRGSWLVGNPLSRPLSLCGRAWASGWLRPRSLRAYDQIEPGNIVKGFLVSRKQTIAVLNRLTRKPHVLDTVAMAAASCFEVCRQVTENLAGGSVDRQERLALQAAERCLALLSDTRVRRVFNAKLEFGNGNRRKIDRGISCNRRDIRRCQQPLFDIDPNARVDQEAHGSRVSLSS